MSQLLNQFSIAPEALKPMPVLRYGAAHVSCNTPFNQNIGQSQVNQNRVKCIYLNGATVMKISHSNAAQPILNQGASFLFPIEYSRRFSGKKVLVEFTLACNGCDYPILAIYMAPYNRKSGWKKLDASPSFKVVSFAYDVPEAEVDMIKKGPIVVVNRFPNNIDAKVFIKNISIYEAAQNVVF